MNSVQRFILATGAVVLVAVAWISPAGATSSSGCDALEDVRTFLTTQVGRTSDAAIHVELVWETGCVDGD